MITQHLPNTVPSSNSHLKSSFNLCKGGSTTFTDEERVCSEKVNPATVNVCHDCVVPRILIGPCDFLTSDRLGGQLWKWDCSLTCFVYFAVCASLGHRVYSCRTVCVGKSQMADVLQKAWLSLHLCLQPASLFTRGRWEENILKSILLAGPCVPLVDWTFGSPGDMWLHESSNFYFIV